jgi:hypothetical protein
MDYTMFHTKIIKFIGKIFSTTIGPKPLNLSIKLIFWFRFIDFEEVQRFIFRFQKIHITVFGGVIDQCHEIFHSTFCQLTIHLTKI